MDKVFKTTHRVFALVLIVSCFVFCICTNAVATDFSYKDIPNWSGIMIPTDVDEITYEVADLHSPISPLATSKTISADSYKTFGSYSFGSSSKTITVSTTSSNGFNLTVWLQNSKADIVGTKNLTINSAGSASWTVRPTTSGTYTLYIYNNSNSAVTVTVSVS